MYQFQFDPFNGELRTNGTTSGPINPPFTKSPRHIAAHPNQTFFYSSNEHKGGISFWQMNSKGQLSLKQTLSSLPDDFNGASTAADVHVSPNGKFVYVSNRGGKDATSKIGSNTLAGFKIDQSTGMLTSIGHFSAPKRPRSFAISPLGKFLLCAGQSDSKLFLYKIKQDNGKLEKIGEYQVSGRANWIVFHKPYANKGK